MSLFDVVIRRTVVAPVRAWALMLACCVMAAACGARTSQQSQPSGPFEDVESLVIAPDTVLHSVKVQMRDRGRLSYPPGARRVGVEAGVVVAFVIDTAGRVEPRTMTFLEPAPSFEFQQSLCDWTHTVRFATPLVDGRPRRVLVVQPFGFSLGDNAPDRQPDAEPYSARLRNAAPIAVVEYLKRQPHCHG
jgi:TonB family protein